MCDQRYIERFDPAVVLTHRDFSFPIHRVSVVSMDYSPSPDCKFSAVCTQYLGICRHISPLHCYLKSPFLDGPDNFKRIHPNLIERVASSCVGLAKGVIISCLILLILASSFPGYRPIWNSRIFSLYALLADKISLLFPPQFRFNYEEKSKEYNLKKFQEKKPSVKTRI